MHQLNYFCIVAISQQLNASRVLTIYLDFERRIPYKVQG